MKRLLVRFNVVTITCLWPRTVIGMMILQFRFVGTVGVAIKSSIVCVAESTLCGTVIKAFKCDTWLRARYHLCPVFLFEYCQ